MSHNLNQKSGQITLRGIPANLLKDLKKEAQKKKRSLNQVLLERILPPQEKPKEGNCAELLDLAGHWDKDKAREFNGALREIRKIDSHLWNK